eukprot:365661-Chlamydomonas_euryale.AAC.78
MRGMRACPQVPLPVPPRVSRPLRAAESTHVSRQGRPRSVATVKEWVARAAEAGAGGRGASTTHAAKITERAAAASRIPHTRNRIIADSSRPPATLRAARPRPPVLDSASAYDTSRRKKRREARAPALARWRNARPPHLWRRQGWLPRVACERALMARPAVSQFALVYARPMRPARARRAMSTA